MKSKKKERHMDKKFQADVNLTEPSETLISLDSDDRRILVGVGRFGEQGDPIDVTIFGATTDLCYAGESLERGRTLECAISPWDTLVKVRLNGTGTVKLVISTSS